MARKRYTNGRIIDFPEGSGWRETWEEMRNIAFLRRVTVGVVVLEAMQQYIEREHKRKKQREKK